MKPRGAERHARNRSGGKRCLLLAVSLLVFTVTGSSAASKPASDILRVICHVAMPWVVGNQVVEPLIYVDNENNFIFSLADSYRIYDDYMDVALKKDVIFQDGAPFNAASVIMNWKAYQQTADPYFTIDLRLAIRTIEILSSHRLRIWFKEDGFIALMPVYLRSFYMYSPSYFERSKGIYPSGNQANLLEPGPWGTGPYILREVRENKTVAVLEKNAHYREKGRPQIDTVMIYGPGKYSNLTAHRLMKHGQADLFDAVSPSMLPMMARSDSIALLIKHPLSSLTTLFNLRKPASPLRDIRVRKALNLLIDRRTLFKYLGHGRALMTAFVFPLSTKGQTLQPYPYRPEAAKGLLHEAGYSARNPLVLTIGYFISEKKLAHAIAAMLEDGGVKVLFQEYATRYEWYQRVLKSAHGPENPMENETWDLNISNIGLYTNSVATHLGESFTAEGGYRWILPDATADGMFLQAMKRKELKEAEDSLLELEKYLYEQYYMMPIYISPTILAVHKRIAENSFSSSGYLLNLKEIEID